MNLGCSTGKRCSPVSVSHANVTLLTGRYMDTIYIQCSAGSSGPTGIEKEVFTVTCLANGTWNIVSFCKGIMSLEIQQLIF